MANQPQVRAAGGVIVREGAEGPEVALVHRPGYDDWSFPKGKLDDGESWKQAALREVWEETGLRCELGDELESVDYTDRKGRSKRVRYWRMTVLKGEFEINDEVDEIAWSSPGDAANRLTYARDKHLLDSL